MTEPELKKLFDLYNDLWKMTREHHGAALTDRAAELVGKYGAETRSIILDALELIERRFKHGYKENHKDA